MNTQKFFVILIVFSTLLSACSAGVTQSSPILGQPKEEVQVVVEKEAQSQNQPQPQEAFQAQPTQAPLIAAAPATNAAWPTQAAAETFPGAVPTPADNYFQGYGVNPFVDALEDHLSTFSLDVDTASYSVMRRYLMDGNLPPADAVRVEEFVNYFDQGYPTPPEIAFGVYADGAPSPFDNPGVYLVRFGIQGYQVPEWQRQPASLTFVIDVSGSMSRENRLELVKQSLNLLVDRLRPDDTVAIVVYGTTARVVLYPTNGSDRSTILNAIYSLQPEGSTNAEAGLLLGYEIAARAYRSNANNRLILCSDGVANVGATSPDEILAKVRGYVEEGLYLTTVGFGMGNFNDALMEQLADNGNGNYAYVDSLEEAQSLFVDNLTSTLQVIALNAKVQIDFNADVISHYRLLGYENRDVADQDFRNDAVDAGEIGAGHSATAIYAVVLKQGTQGRIATVQLRWEDPQTHEVQEINGNFNSWDLAERFDQSTPRYQLAVLAAQYADVLRNSPWASRTTFGQLYNMAQPLRYSLPEDPAVGEFVDLMMRASQIKP